MRFRGQLGSSVGEKHSRPSPFLGDPEEQQDQLKGSDGESGDQ